MIRVIQVALILTLLYLAMRPRTRATNEKRSVAVGDPDLYHQNAGR